MTLKPSSKSFMLFMMVMSTSALMSCAALTSNPTVTPTNTATEIPTKTAIPTATVTLTPTSSHLAIVTPRDWKSEEMEFLLVIQESLRTDNREKFASLIHYPIKVSLLDESELEIENAAEFVANYETIVIPEWKDLVLNQDPAEMLSNWQGAMVHRGELWFMPVCLDETCEHSQFYIVVIRQIDWSK